MASHAITISVDKRGNLTYTHPSLRAKRNEKVSWTCDVGPFAVDFAGQTPSARLKDSSKKGAVEMHIRADAAPGRYKYFVAVAHKDQVLTDDPEIIIEFF
jgi:hypothetical protein